MPLAMDRPHTKSRLGCKECKLRRVKCDESRPVCARCSRSRRQCSYLADIPTLPASPSSTSTSNSTSSAAFQPLPVAAPDPSPNHAGAGAAPRHLALEERYGLLHLNLLHYFEHELIESMGSVHPGLQATLPMLTAEAFKVPYLMDELLALSAAHKSTQAPETRFLYATEATRLQTRALEALNRLKPQVSAENCMPMFIFSSLVGQQALFDVSSAVHDDLGTVLEGLIHCIGLHRGIGIIANSAWPLLQARLWGQAAEACTGGGALRGSDESSHDDFDELLRRIDDSSLSAPMIVANRQATLILRPYFSSLSPSSTPSSHWMAAVQEWMIGVPSEYVECLRQRRQEALVVLAHYAVMLHYTSRYWFVGDLGARLIHLITRHLGSYWEAWLEWPNRMIAEQHVMV
ncbi:hypothetical protein B0I35DRAFT_441113 [Stachybotrys elegans]|uniref:Zn(2)-C6 fungal-type domain-containing protein n=1 Tax=Stachybotrys elegans TaxID=80388 RepID=A0A8K0SLF8_9HYPO|nr:hypothetical protein B0I35DRAFT_441113 [Stachybotrys elegans]